MSTTEQPPAEPATVDGRLPDTPRFAIAGRKREAARRAERRAAALRVEADQIELNALELRAEIVRQRIAQGLGADPTDEQIAFVGNVIAADQQRTTTVTH